jgi:hypothetical protein
LKYYLFMLYFIHSSKMRTFLVLAVALGLADSRPQYGGGNPIAIGDPIGAIGGEGGRPGGFGGEGNFGGQGMFFCQGMLKRKC